MTIQVELTDGTLCRVVPKGLDLLLKRHLVKRFRRDSGWAIVGVDRVRLQAINISYVGPERRYAT